MPVAAVEQAAVNGGVPPDQAGAVAADYGDAQLDALQLSLGAVALTALLSLCLTRRLSQLCVSCTGSNGVGMHTGSDKRSARPSPWRIALISRRRLRTRLR